MNSLWLAFLTGLTTGGLSCLAVQGGLLASAATSQGKERNRSLVITFLISKIIAYALLGFGLGLLGASLTISPKLQGIFQIAAGIFMLLTAGRLLDLHPIFRYAVIQPPKFVFKLVRKTSKDNSHFTPALLGFMTVLIPCGITQSMLLLAIASSSPWQGAGIMFFFTLGTSPVFLALGVATLELLKRKVFAFAAALVIAVLGIMSVNSGQTLRGSFHTLQNYYKAATGNVSGAQDGQVAGVNTEGKQEAVITVLENGYSSSVSKLKAGVPVKLKLVTNGTRSCTRSFTIPQLNISKVLPQSGSEVVEFTPTQTGRLSYSCGMGMFGGTFQVIN